MPYFRQKTLFYNAYWPRVLVARVNSHLQCIPSICLKIDKILFIFVEK